MSSFFDQHLNIENLHHAYLIEGDGDLVVPELISFFDNSYGDTKNNPDFVFQNFETFTIEDSRNIKKVQIEKGVGDKKFYIFNILSFTREAENALLKVFEEPTAGVHFFIIFPKVEILLATLKSRFYSIKFLAREIDQEKLKEARRFIGLNKIERLNFIKELLKKSNDENESNILPKIEINSMLNYIEYLLWKAFQGSKDKEKYLEIFEELNKCRSLIWGRGSSIKMIFEHLALIIPHNL